MSRFSTNDRVRFEEISKYSARNSGYTKLHFGRKGRYWRFVENRPDYGTVVAVIWDGSGDAICNVFEQDLQPDTKPAVHFGNLLMRWKWGDPGIT